VWAVLVAAAAPSAQHSPSQPAHDAQAAAEHAPEEGGLMKTVAKLFNFALLVGVLVYFLKAPIAGYLETRGAGIRAGLVAAATVRETATAQLAEIQRKMQSLPGELEALRARGADDLRAEQARIAEAARAERDRVLEQTRREIAMRLGIAKRQLTEDAAELAVGVAEQRIRRSITSEDQLRLVDRYAAQLKEAAR
jgi:F-type H+-transporting ATPase subunit b